MNRYRQIIVVRLNKIMYFEKLSNLTQYYGTFYFHGFKTAF